MARAATKLSTSNTSRTDRLAALVLSIWAGGLWTVCGVVVPALFWWLPDVQQAGNMAAKLFYAEVGLGTVFGLMYWGLRRNRLAQVDRRLLIAAIGAPLVFFIVLRPMMSAARAAGDMARFGQLHGAASLLFLVACVGVGWLVWRVAAPRS